MDQVKKKELMSLMTSGIARDSQGYAHKCMYLVEFDCIEVKAYLRMYYADNSTRLGLVRFDTYLELTRTDRPGGPILKRAHVSGLKGLPTFCKEYFILNTERERSI